MVIYYRWNVHINPYTLWMKRIIYFHYVMFVQSRSACRKFYFILIPLVLFFVKFIQWICLITNHHIFLFKWLNMHQFIYINLLSSCHICGITPNCFSNWSYMSYCFNKVTLFPLELTDMFDSSTIQIFMYMRTIYLYFMFSHFYIPTIHATTQTRYAL